MAGTKQYGTLGPEMSRFEMIGGFLYLPVYVIGLAWLLGLILAALGRTASETTVNVLYFLINFVAVALIFRRWLIASLGRISRRFWPFLQAAVLGVAFYYALSWALGLVFSFLRISVSNPNDGYVAQLAGANFRLIAVGTILLAPMVEETLFRGLIFGNLHQKSRFLAYALSALAFSAIHVWGYVGQVGWTATLLCALQYLPAGVALGWTYEKADTIWAPILVHSMVNAVGMGLMHG